MSFKYFSMQEPAYNPQVEAISPTLPPEETLKAQKIKEEISEKLNLVEREIGIAKSKIATSKKKLQVGIKWALMRQNMSSVFPTN